MKTLVIIDASVLLTALFGSNDRVSQQLNQLLRDDTHDAYILPYTIIEFANGVRFSTRDKPTATRIVKQFDSLSLAEMSIMQSDITAIIDLAYRLSTTVYDTAYHYVAILREGTFVTCDKQYFKKASSLGHIECWG